MSHNRTKTPEKIISFIDKHVRGCVGDDGICSVNYPTLAALLYREHKFTLGLNALYAHVRRSRVRQGLNAPTNPVYTRPENPEKITGPHRQTAPIIATPAVVASIERQAPPIRTFRVAECQWPIGDPGTRNFKFCCLPTEPGKPYCNEHAKLAYVKVRDQREDAA